MRLAHKLFFLRVIFLPLLLLAISAIVVVPSIVSAHEVYVLSPGEIGQAISTPSPNPFSAIPGEVPQFFLSAMIIMAGILVSLYLSTLKYFERLLGPLLRKLKKYAPLVGRVALGASLVASGYFGSFFGPELAVSQSVSPVFIQTTDVLLIVLGIFILVGFLTRLSVLVAMIIFGYTVLTYRFYMLTYLNYFGEMILCLILGGGHLSLDRLIPRYVGVEKLLEKIAKMIEPYSFLILRIFFGVSLFFASFYAKFVHSNLALATVNDYHLTNYFHFTPLFLVLGAFLVEALLGLCFALGFQIRLASIVFTFFLVSSLLFFGEAVWPHLILFGVNFALFFHGYDHFTLTRFLFRKRSPDFEPIF